MKSFPLLKRTLTLAFIAAIALLPTKDLAADAMCGDPYFSWESYPPRGPFMSGDDYRFLYTTKFDAADVGDRSKEKTTIPLTLFFSPMSAAYVGSDKESEHPKEMVALFSSAIADDPNGRLLGQGWWFPAFESALLPTSDSTYVLSLPNGTIAILRKEGNTLSSTRGSAWDGTIKPDATILKSTNGWTAKFHNNRLFLLESPDGKRYHFDMDDTGTRTISRSGNTIAVLTRTIDAKTTFPVYTLSYTSNGKPQKIKIRMGQRPVPEKYTEKENGSDVVKERQKNTASVYSIKIGQQPEKRYNFAIDTLVVARNDFKLTAQNLRWNVDSFKWDNSTARVLEMNGTKFSTVKIRGVECLQQTLPNGKTKLFGSDHKSGIFVEKTANAPIEIHEAFPNYELSETSRRVFRVMPNDQEELFRQTWIDENKQIVRQLMTMPEGTFIYERKGNTLTATDAKSKKLIWKKLYDTAGKIVEYQMDETIYRFAPDKNNAGYVIITQITPTGTNENSVPQTTFDSLIEKL